MERGTGLGEIALLSVPRTVTVTAAVDGLRVAVDRSPFLVTVTGHDSSRQTSWGVIRSLTGDVRAVDSPTADAASADEESDPSPDDEAER